MRVIKPAAVILDKQGITPYQMIERVGRTCYKSEDSITDDSAVRFVANMQKNRHFAMLEHAHLYFDCTAFVEELRCIYQYPELIKYFNITDRANLFLVSGSFRAFLEFFEELDKHSELRNWKMVEYKCSLLYPEVFANPYENKETDLDLDLVKNAIHHYTRDEFITVMNHQVEAKDIFARHLTHTVLFTCDRGVTHEFVRHRPASFAQESTRYCNYSKGKFGNEITVIEPCFFEEGTEEYTIWKEACESAEKKYFELLSKGRTPQEARAVLPNSLKADLIITATEEEWKHIIELRYTGVTGKPHPQMVEVMSIAYPLLVEESEGRLRV